MREMWLGIDVGSTTVKLVLLDSGRRLLDSRYLRAGGQPRRTLLDGLESMGVAEVALAGVALTGSGGAAVAELLGAPHVNELVAQVRAVGALHPEARTIIEIGGQDSKFLSVARDERGEMSIADFAMNTLCAAGTGSFLDQQAERLGIRIDGEFASLALRSEAPARLAGRCTVFAKSDMIHLQQQGTPLPDILAGLCLALARNFKGVIGKGKPFTPPVLFQGGVAANAAVVRAFETTLGLPPGAIVVPEHHRHMAALGAAYCAMDEQGRDGRPPFAGFGPLRAAAQGAPAGTSSLPPLRAGSFRAGPAALAAAAPSTRVALGVDVGSISTNVVLVDEQGRVVARRYVRTAGRPLDAVRDALRDVGAEVGASLAVCAVGTTGSGRYLVGDYVGADVVRNEITAQAKAAVAVDPSVDTIFEMGGQDSKYIRIEGGAVVDFAMNNACAAGTGSFLEEQAARLRLAIEDEFGAVALAARAPAALGERCTVFMESDLVHHQQRGATVPDLAAGLAYSVVENYLNRVVGGRPLGRRVFFQGGVASNPAVAAAFAQKTGRTVVVPPHHDVTGAIGAALLAREAVARPGAAPTRFRGFDLGGARTYEARAFVCRACPNLCEVSRVAIGGERPAFYGARCEKFEGLGRERARTAAEVADPFADRHALLLGEWTDPGPRNGHLRVAIPRVLTFFDMFPFWRGFFREAGVDVVLSSPTSPATVQKAQEQAAIESCFPVKLAYGHVAELQEADADFLLLPAVVDRENVASGQARNQYCPFIPAVPYVVGSHLELDARGPRPLLFPLHMLSRATARRELGRALREPLGLSGPALRRATEAGRAALNDFQSAVRRRGREVLDALPGGRLAAVVVSRPYNSGDLGACQDLPCTLRTLGVLPLPTDFLPLESAPLPPEAGDMYWRCGQDILSAAQVIARDARLQAVYLTNFNCGPDSFLLGSFRRLMRGKPFLELEVDDHTADAGIVTRCEAFFDSVRSRGAP